MMKNYLLYLFGIGYLFYSIYSMKKRNDNIGHEAHLGGAIASFNWGSFYKNW